MVQFPLGIKYVSLLQTAQTGSGAQPMGMGCLSHGEKRPGREVYQSPNLAPRLIMSGAVPPLPNLPSWRVQGQIYLFTLNTLSNVTRPTASSARYTPSFVTLGA
jgi:hypothetical protein